MFVLSTSKHLFYLSFTSNLHACSRDSSTRIFRRHCYRLSLYLQTHTVQADKEATELCEASELSCWRSSLF
ncbi:hypothetical protein Sjap_014333 [Stephania japonica]|uniref:Uncharacterized protein n=1 Tax=Stephania japonica TaxID=461633 RepID=A0AAP0IZP7_9MAGN